MSVAASDQTEPEVKSLLRRVASVRHKQVGVALGTGMAMAAGIIFSALTLEMTLDRQIELPWPVRALIAAAVVGAVGFIAWKYLLIPFFRKPDDDTAALLIERALPVFRSRFIAAVQLARDPEVASPLLVNALIAETTALAATQDFQGVVKTARLRRMSRISLWTLIACALFCAFAGKTALPLLQRACLLNVPLPHKTQIVKISGGQFVGIGDDFKIGATAAGVIPQQGKLIVTRGKAAPQELPFPREFSETNGRQFSGLIQNVQESFTYTVRLGDATSEAIRVTAIPRPAVTRLECLQTYPAYTGMGSVKRAPGDLSLLEGSRLEVRGRASAKLKTASLRLSPSGQDVPLSVNPTEKQDFAGTLPIAAKDLHGFFVHMVEEHGVESRDTATYRIDVVPDKPPTVQIIHPERREELITQNGTLLIAFEANDDFGVTHVVLHYVVSKDSGTGVEKKVELDLDRKFPRKLNRRYEWKMTALRPLPIEGTIVEYWLEARDNNDVTGPGITFTDHYQAKVVSEAEKRADLSGRLNDALSSLTEITQDEEQLNQTLGTLIFAKPEGR